MKRKGPLVLTSRRQLAVLVFTVMVATSIQSCSSVPRRLAPTQVNLLSLNVLESGPEGQLFALQVQLVNPNTADIPIERFSYDIRLGGEGRLIGEYSTEFLLPGRGSETLDVEVFSELVSSASRLMAFTQGPNNQLSYEFQGELFIGSSLREPLPVFRRGQVALEISAQGQ
jgi:LEA14-like dessication related protein